jgi:hypothetical protein
MAAKNPLCYPPSEFKRFGNGLNSCGRFNFLTIRGSRDLIETAKGWADSYLWFATADSYIWLGIGCLALLAFFEIIERNARRKKQRMPRMRSREPSKDKLVADSEVTNSKQTKADQHKARRLPQRKTT